MPFCFHELASVFFGVGLISQVIGVIRAGLLKGAIRIVVFTVAIVFLISVAVPSGWGLYVVAAAALVVYLLIANTFWRGSMQ